MILSTALSRHMALIKTLQQEGYNGKIAVAAKNQDEANFYNQQGVNLVLIPYQDAALEAVHKITNFNLADFNFNGELK